MNTNIIKNDVGFACTVQRDAEEYKNRHQTILNGKDITDPSVFTAKRGQLPTNTLQQKIINEIYSTHFQVEDDIPCFIIKNKNFYCGWVEDHNHEGEWNRSGIVLFLFGKKTPLDICISSLSLLEKVNIEAFKTEYKLKVK